MALATWWFPDPLPDFPAPPGLHATLATDDRTLTALNRLPEPEAEVWACWRCGGQISEHGAGRTASSCWPTDTSEAAPCTCAIQRKSHITVAP
jgi:hypothetical protein